MKINTRILSVSVQLLFFLFYFSSQAQSSSVYSEGYFIDENDTKVECFILNENWFGNPLNFKYKLSQDSKIQKADINSVKEFRIYDTDHFYKRIRLSSDLEAYDQTKVIKRKGETIFVKVLINSEAGLYSYYGDSFKFFLYGDNNPELLKYTEKFKTLEGNKIIKGREFQKQLYEELNCKKFKISRYSKLKYYVKDLVEFFEDYHDCKNYDYENLHNQKTPFKFDFKINIGTNIVNTPSSNFDYSYIFISDAPPSTGADEGPIEQTSGLNLNFDNHISYLVGFESEFFVPYFRNNLSLFFSPNYQYSRVESDSFKLDFSEETFPGFESEYSLIELPVGVRYYKYINDNLDVYTNIAFAHYVNLNSNFIENLDQNLPDFDNGFKFTEESLNENPSNVGSIIFGIGGKYKGRYSFALNYYLTNSTFHKESYGFDIKNTVNLLLSYKLF